MRAVTFAVVISSLLMCVFKVSENMKVIPQKANLTYLNEKYIEWASFAVKRYGRKSDYYMNLEGRKYHAWGNNLTLHLVFNEFLHNEYRRSFVEMHLKICDMLNNDIIVGAMFTSFKIKCPVVEKELHLMNMTVPTKEFEYKLPFEKSRIDGVLVITKTGEKVGEGYIYVQFKP